MSLPVPGQPLPAEREREREGGSEGGRKKRERGYICMGVTERRREGGRDGGRECGNEGAR